MQNKAKVVAVSIEAIMRVDSTEAIVATWAMIDIPKIAIKKLRFRSEIPFRYLRFGVKWRIDI